MDWNDITTLAQTQGTVFWVATAAVSLGLTLLILALAQAAQQRIARRSVASGLARPAAAPEPTIASGATAAVAPQDPPLPPPADEEGSLVMMLRRLQQAGDRLEEIATDRQASPFRSESSALKSEFQDVEYVFRASGS